MPHAKAKDLTPVHFFGPRPGTHLPNGDIYSNRNISRGQGFPVRNIHSAVTIEETIPGDLLLATERNLKNPAPGNVINLPSTAEALVPALDYPSISKKSLCCLIRTSTGSMLDDMFGAFRHTSSSGSSIPPLTGFALSWHAWMY